MLPAKFRGFASRVGRLASRALALHKDGERDGATARTSGNVTIARTARTSRTFRRALFAMLVSAATLLAILVVPPVNNANAAQVWWDYAGNGYVTSTGSWVGDAVNQINMPYPKIEDVNYNGETRKKITWTVTFNSQGIGAKSASQNQFPGGNQPSKGSAYGGQPTLYAWLPSGIEDSSITIYREVTVRKTWGGVTDFDWQKARSSKDFPGNHPGDYTNYVFGDIGSSRWTYYKGDSNFEGHDWNKSLGPGTGSKVEGVGSGSYGAYAKDYDMCEVYAWKRENKFSRVFISQEKDDSTISHRWTISAIVDRGQNPFLLTFAAGWISAKEFKTRFVVSGPFDTDGDGIPDSVEHHHNMNPKSPDDILYPQFNESMLKDYGKDNVPITTYGRKITEKPYIKTGHWKGNSSEGNFVYDGGTSTDLPTDLGIRYSITGISDNTIKIANSPNNISEGYAYIDPNTGHLTYNPRKEDRNKTITFHTKISYPNSGSYNCKHKDAKEFTHDTKIKVVSQASIYNPQYKETNVGYDPEQKKFRPTDSAEPKSVAKSGNPLIRTGNLPKGTKFEVKQYTMKIGGSTNPRGDGVLPWSSISKKSPDNTGNGKVTFKPNKSNAGESNHTPVLVTYPDGSTSEDKDAGNDGVVYAPVKVGDLPISGGDLNLGLYDGTSIDNNGFWGFSFRDKTNPHEIDKGKKMGLPDKDHENPNKGIVFDSWANNGKGPITFRVICHRTDVPNSPFMLLKPAEGNEKASGEINGLHFEDFRQWIRDNDKKCKGKDCSNDNLYLHSREYDNNTMERSRAMIGGTPNEGGSYECKVFAFHEKYDDKDNHGGSLKAFDDTAKNAGSTEYSILFNNYETIKKDTKGSEWLTDNFYFKIKLKDNQKYNPTYTEMPTIEAGSTFDKNLKNHKDAISSGAPQSNNKTSKNSKGQEVGANGVPKEDLVNVKEGALPAGTWYEIKRFVKAGDITNSKASSLPWANFEDGEDNKADGKAEAKDSNATNKGSVTFRPDKWQDADEYWAEVKVHYPDGSVSDGDDSINKNHPIYAKVKVTRPAIGNKDLHLNVYKQYENGKFTGYVDDVNGIVVMKGVGLLKDMGIDSWSTAKPEGITLRALCRDDSDEAKKSTTHTWSENLDNLFFKLNWQQAWKYPTFARQEACRKGSNNGDHCNTGDEHFLFDSTGGTMERARGTITSDKAPTKSGKYYCVVLAMKKEAMDQYNKALWHTNGKISVTNNNFAKAIGFTGKSDEDYAVKFFPVTVVDKFALPKTGGMNWNVLLGAFAVIGTGVMAAGFFLEQTKWGRAMLDALLRKTLIKDFICKTAKKLRALRRRSERWRC